MLHLVLTQVTSRHGLAGSTKHPPPALWHKDTCILPYVDHSASSVAMHSSTELPALHIAAMLQHMSLFLAEMRSLCSSTSAISCFERLIMCYMRIEQHLHAFESLLQHGHARRAWCACRLVLMADEMTCVCRGDCNLGLYWAFFADT